jgi:hypothetical protein
VATRLNCGGAGAGGGGVEDEHVEVGVAQGRQDGIPSALPGPAVESPPGAVPAAEALGQVAPRDAGAGDVQDGIDEQAVVGGDAAVLPGQQVLDATAIGVRDGVPRQHGRPSVAYSARGSR